MNRHTVQSILVCVFISVLFSALVSMPLYLSLHESSIYGPWVKYFLLGYGFSVAKNRAIEDAVMHLLGIVVACSFFACVYALWLMSVEYTKETEAAFGLSWVEFMMMGAIHIFLTAVREYEKGVK